jgi:hypothetical protein
MRKLAHRVLRFINHLCVTLGSCAATINATRRAAPASARAHGRRSAISACDHFSAYYPVEACITPNAELRQAMGPPRSTIAASSRSPAALARWRRGRFVWGYQSPLPPTRYLTNGFGAVGSWPSPPAEPTETFGK